MKRAISIILAVLFVTTGQSELPPYHWLGGTDISPQHPTSADTIAITVWGEWPNSCVPNGSAVEVTGNHIYFDVLRDYSDGVYCLTVISPWARAEDVGPLPEGTYTIYAQLLENGITVDPYCAVATFVVTNKQFVITPESLSIPEGQTATFTVKLLNEPDGTVPVTVAWQDGDPDITVQAGGSLSFKPSNWSVPQTVTLAAAEDPDYFHGQATISITAPGYLPASVTATETDNDVPAVLYVDQGAPGARNGRSWADACTDLQNALGLAGTLSGVEEIRVAKGIYKPAEPGGNRNTSFALVAGVAVRGGYAGYGQPDPNARNTDLFESILSGDLNGNDGPNFTNVGDNSYTVVLGANGAVLDGFTITGGCDATHGGGINNKSRATTIINCVIKYNRAAYGGGLYTYNGRPTLINCLFIGNQAKPNTIGDGGGLYCQGDSGGPFVTNCTFVKNSASETGGGICSYQPETDILNCIFWANSDEGGFDESAQIDSSTAVINYCCIQGWTGSRPGVGNIADNPLFADEVGDDYHLKSEAGRWDPAVQAWVADAETSPCIDAGDPGSDWSEELWPHGKRINIGAYGGTPQASMSLSDAGNIANLDNDPADIIGTSDLALLVAKWLRQQPPLKEDLSRDGFVDFHDFALFGTQCSSNGGQEGLWYEIGECTATASAAQQAGEQRFEVTIDDRYIHFADTMSANCCPDKLELQMAAEADLIIINEIEHTTSPCRCICDYPVTATLGPFQPGLYTLNVYQGDYFVGSVSVSIE